MRTEEMLWAGLHAGPVQVLWKETAIKIRITTRTIKLAITITVL